jgi:choice-of-anchor B domain-containing protein
MKFSLIVSLLFFGCIVSAQSFNMKKMANITGLPGTSYSAVFGYTDAQNNEFAIIGSSLAINIFNVNNCGNPINVLTHIDGYNTSWREFSSFQNYIYAICDGNCASGLQIINMNNLSVTSQTGTFTKAHTIFVEQSQGRLYVMGSRNANGQDRLLIYTLDSETVGGIAYHGTASNPVLIRDFPTTYIHDMFVKNNVGYASHIYEFKTRVWNLSDVLNVSETNFYYYDSGKYNHSSWLHSDGITLFEATELPRAEPLAILRRVPGNSALQFVGTLKEPLEFPMASNNRPHNPHIKDNYLYVSYYEDGVQVFDVSDVTNQNTIKRIAYFDTYHQNNGNGYPSNFFGCWGVYPFLESGCILASDLDNGLFTLKLDMPVSDGTNPGKVSMAKSTDIIFENNSKGLVMRSDKGYCYRLIVDVNGILSTQRIVCHVNNQSVIKLEKNDLAFEDPTNGVILKDISGNCKKIKINTSGTLVTEPLNCSNAHPQIKMQTSDLIIETYTKGLVLKNTNGNCFRITVNNTGNLQVLPLSSCP